MAQKPMLSPYQSNNRTTQPNKEGVEQCNVPYMAWGHAFPTHGPKWCRAGYDMFANVMNPNLTCYQTHGEGEIAAEAPHHS